MPEVRMVCGDRNNDAEATMTARTRMVAAICLGISTIVVSGSWLDRVQGQQTPGTGFAAVPGLKGGQDIFGPYDVVRNWPKPMSDSLPNHEKFTWSTTMDVFAESPNRVFLVQKGELARIDKRPETKWIPEFGPGLVYPVFRLPLRQAGAGAGSNPLDPPADGQPGVDWRWEHCIVVVDAEGKIVEDWTQWDKLFTRPHDVEISPYDPEKSVWVVDAEGHAVYKFSNDGKKLLLTLGTPRQRGDDDTHFNRPTFLVFMDANTMYVADGYDGTRVIKYHMNGKKLMQWGQKGTPPNEKRPGYFNSVHGIAVDPTTRRVFVNDRTNGRVQVFDENGKYLDEWNFGPRPPMDIHSFIVTSDRKLWAADQGTHKILGYDLNGNFLYSWGSWGEYPGGMWGVHGMSTDQEGNFYVAEVNNGRIQKYRPRPGANPAFLVGKPWKGVS
jgi:DNA-binding beta-propeller fold protein YncE